MRRLTPSAPADTTRKRRRAALAALAALAAAGALAGCATPGALHVYSLSGDAAPPRIDDHGEADAAETPSFLEPGERLTGFAYDPFTDHFFLRLAPGHEIRVVDRPARKIKREFTVDGLGAGGDLAVRPRDGHLFFLEGAPLRVVETTRFGKPVRTFPLQGVPASSGIALDFLRQQVAVLHAGGERITWHDLDGKQFGSLKLEQPVAGSLAFDPERGEFHAPLAASPHRIGVFDAQGRLQRELPVRAQFVDLGPRSFLRVF